MLGFTLISGIDLLLFLTLRVVYEFFFEPFAKVSPSTVQVKENDKGMNTWMANTNDKNMKKKVAPQKF